MIMSDWARDDEEKRLIWFRIWAEVIRWCAQVATPILLGFILYKLW